MPYDNDFFHTYWQQNINNKQQNEKKNDKSKTMETKQTIEKALTCTVHVCEMILNLTLISFIYTKDQQQFDQCILTTIGKHWKIIPHCFIHKSLGCTFTVLKRK